MNINIKGLIAIAVGLILCSNEQAHSEISANEYEATVTKLAKEYKDRLDKYIRLRNLRNWETKYNSLNALKHFYLKAPSKISLNWGVLGTGADAEPYEKTPGCHRAPKHVDHWLTRIMNNNGKGIYIVSPQINYFPQKYWFSDRLSFYDPSGRYIECRARLLSFDLLNRFIKSCKLGVIKGRTTRKFQNVTGNGIDRNF